MKNISINYLLTLLVLFAGLFSSCQKTETSELTIDNPVQILKNGSECNPDQTIGIQHNQILEYIFSFEGEIEAIGNDVDAFKSFAYQKTVERMTEMGYDPGNMLSESEVDQILNFAVFNDGDYSGITSNDFYNEEEQGVLEVLFESSPKITTEDGLQEFLGLVGSLECSVHDLGSPNQVAVQNALSVAGNSAMYWNGIASNNGGNVEREWGDILLADAAGAATGAIAGSYLLIPGIFGGALIGAGAASAVAYWWQDAQVN